jgi:Domain of unknown function (DUF4333)
MSRPGRLFAVLGLLVIAFSAAGCGTVVDPVKLQDTIQADLEKSLHVKIQAVDCPSDVSVDPGATFTCEVVFPDGEREVATLKIRNKDADITMIGLKPEN